MKCTIQRSLAALLSFALILPLSVHAAQDDDQNKDDKDRETQVEKKDDQESPVFPTPDSTRAADADKDKDDKDKDKDKDADKPAEQPSRIQTDRRDYDDRSAIDGQKHSDKTAKAFELEHRSPEEMKQLIKMCEEGLKPHEVGAQRQQPGIGQQQGVQRRGDQQRDFERQGAQRDQQRAGAQPGQQQAGQQRPGQAPIGQQADERQRTQRATYDEGMNDKKIVVAISEENDILFVRASKEHMEQVQKLVDCFDVEDSKLKKAEMEKVTIIPVSLDDARQVESALQQEQLQNHQIFKMGQVAVVVIGDDEQNGENRKKAEEAVSEFEKKGDKDKDAESDTDRPASQRDSLSPQAQPGQTPSSQPGQRPGSQPGQTPQPQSTN